MERREGSLGLAEKMNYTKIGSKMFEELSKMLSDLLNAKQTVFKTEWIKKIVKIF